MRFHHLAGAMVAAAALVTLSLTRSSAADEAKPEYVGDKACQKCHFKPQHASWKKTGMANALKALQPTTEADNKALFDKKKAANLDPAKDYTTDAKCLQCHTTGYGEAGGYPADPKKDEAAGKLATLMGKVSCEACHGAGSLYVKYKEEIVSKNNAEKKETKFAWEDLAKQGLVKPDANLCAKCHNDQNPTKPAEAFKFDDAKAKVHDHK
jgi:cytochrome c554/c'-like protein